MWIEERQSKKGTRYKYCERFELPNGEIRKVSVIFNTNSSHARKQATIELQRKYEQAVKEIDINNLDSDDPLVQACLDRFKTDMGDKYKDHIFSEEEIQEITTNNIPHE